MSLDRRQGSSGQTQRPRSLAENYRTDILLVTATQPALFDSNDRIEIGPPDNTHSCWDAFDRYDVEVEIEKAISPAALGERIVNQLLDEKVKTCVVVVNTIGEALKIYDWLKNAEGCRGHQLFHLSTNLRSIDRERILEAIRSCIVPHVVVATQVIEAGVDLSFDLLFRALAPLDAVVQAAGRCNRHGIGSRGFVRIVELEGNHGVVVYGQLHMAVARELLVSTLGEHSLKRLREPQLRVLVHQYFERLNSRISQGCATSILEAVRLLQFAALRGEGNDSNRRVKQIRLIHDQFDRIPHFVEVDNSDADVWSELNAALNTKDLRARRQRLRVVRNRVGRRIVEVPRREAAQIGADETTGLVHVPVDSSAKYYDTQTGWKRRL